MGLFDKAKDLAGKNTDKVDQGVESAGDFVDEKTGGQYADQVDQGQQFANEQFGGGDQGGDGQGGDDQDRQQQ